ncbi:glycosyltransferase family 4 protein [Chitinophaga rhizosphaerae]|uniref:glycosyltransferase family 4 protein n=1 Tax=Chitinophaga rhizosphaerae TaxID=1864947 RepID=UPI000F808131|nr:glycosyltransferase family 4 protein [Chitinophaga rhizosphaerae]
MNIIFFTNISTFPYNGGEKLRSYYLLKALSDLGHTVHAVIRNEEEADLSKYALPNVAYHIHPKKPLAVTERLTGSHYFTKSPAVMDLFGKICREHDIDTAVLDYGYVGHYIGFFRRRGIRVVLGTHNAQPEISRQLPARSLIQKFRKMQLVTLEQWHERSYFAKADAVLVVSHHDLDYHRRFIDPDKLFLVPNFLDEAEYALKAPRQQRLLVMTANFTVYQNFEGLRWFVQEVWNPALAEKFRLQLVGRGSREALQKITGSTDWQNIVALGRVDDVKQYIASAEGVVIPLLHGSGTRLKCLEAMALHTPVIATSRGVEGVLSHHFIVADSAADFRTALLRFEGSPQRGDALRADFMKEYSAAVNRQRLAEAIHFAQHVQ